MAESSYYNRFEVGCGFLEEVEKIAWSGAIEGLASSSSHKVKVGEGYWWMVDGGWCGLRLEQRGMSHWWPPQ